MGAVRDPHQRHNRGGVEERQQFDKRLRVREKRAAPIQVGIGTLTLFAELRLPAKGLHQRPDGLLKVVVDDRRRDSLQHVLVRERFQLSERQERHVVPKRHFRAHAQTVEERDVVADQEIVGTGHPLQVPLRAPATRAIRKPLR